MTDAVRSAQRSPRFGRDGRGSHWAMLLMLALFWGTAFLFTHVAVESVPPLTLVTVRVVVASVLLHAVRIALGLRLPRGGVAWLQLLALSLTGAALPFSLISWGQQSVPSGIAGVLMAVVPLVVIVLAHFVLRGDRMTPRRLGGFLLGFSGVLLLLGPRDLMAGVDAPLAARLAVLGGALCYAIHSVLARRLPGLHPIVYGSALFTIAALLVGPAAFVFEQPLATRAPAVAWSATLWMGIAPTAAATLVHYRLVRTAGPAFASLVSYLIPVVALAAGALVLGEPVGLGALAALALILAGIAWSESGSFGPSRKSQAPACDAGANR